MSVLAPASEADARIAAAATATAAALASVVPSNWSPPEDFAGWTLRDAQAAVAQAIEGGQGGLGRAGYAANVAYVERKDHWQGGDPWPGDTGGPELRQAHLARVARVFTAVDLIGEVLDDLANAVCKTEAAISFSPLAPEATGPDGKPAPSPAQTKEADGWREALAGWWDREKLWDQTRRVVRRSRYAPHATLRPFVPTSRLVTTETQDEAGTVTQSTALPTNKPSAAAALACIALTAPLPDTALLYTHPETRERAAIFLATGADGKAKAELWTLERPAADAAPTATPRSVRRDLVDGQSAEDAARTWPVPMGGALPLAQMEAPLLITAPVRSQQARANYYETILSRVLETAGWRERYTTNAKPNGVWMPFAPQNGPALESKTQDGKTWYLHAAPRAFGPAVMTDLRGIETKQSDNSTRTETPGVEIVDPTDPEYVSKAGQYARHTLYRDCKQAHKAVDSTAESSGVAYEQARAGFVADATNTKGPMEGMLRDLFAAIIALAEHLMGVEPATGFLSRFRIVVTGRVDAGPIPPTERAQNDASYQAGTLSLDSAIAANGGEDVGAEKALLAADPGAQRRQLTEQLAVLAAGAAVPGLNQSALAELVGFDAVTARKLFAVDPNAPVTQ